MYEEKTQYTAIDLLTDKFTELVPEINSLLNTNEKDVIIEILKRGGVL